MEYFKFENEFENALEMFTVNDTDYDNVIRAIISFYPPVEGSEHIIEKDGIDGKVVTTAGGVLLGKMSFKMLTDQFDISGFELVTNTSSPQTGVKVNLDAKTCFEAPPTFRFADVTASKDADLTNIVLSSGENNEDVPEESTYKEYDLTPTFDKETKNYEVILLEYLDAIDITATQSDTNATMKISIPKHDEDGNLVYEDDGTTIMYEEKELKNGIPLEVILNKLGEPDTKLTINVTAEDGATKNTYEVLIKRPYGIIKGNVYTPHTTATTGTYKSDIRIYKSDDVATVIDWSTIVSGATDDVHDKLLTLKSQDYITEDDGTYEIYVIPGTYDVLLDKGGYLDHIYTSKTVNEGDTIDLGQKELLAGDLNKDGSIEISDLSLLLNLFGIESADSMFDSIYDFNEDSVIDISDLSILLSDYLETRCIE